MSTSEGDECQRTCSPSYIRVCFQAGFLAPAEERPSACRTAAAGESAFDEKRIFSRPSAHTKQQNVNSRLTLNGQNTLKYTQRESAYSQVTCLWQYIREKFIDYSA